MVLVEVCVDSLEGARVAVAQGVARMELCAALALGGITPSMGLVQHVRRITAASGTQLMVLIRPRGGDFVYSADELAVMVADIAEVADVGADGVVIGCLQADGSVDTAATRALALAARMRGLTVTFHRAFDVSRDLRWAAVPPTAPLPPSLASVWVIACTPAAQTPMCVVRGTAVNCCCCCCWCLQ